MSIFNLILISAILFQNSVFTHPELNYVSAFPSKVLNFSVCSDTVSRNAISYAEIENLVDFEKLKGIKMAVMDPVIPIKDMVVI